MSSFILECCRGEGGGSSYIVTHQLVDTEPDGEYKNTFKVFEYDAVALLLILLKGYFMFFNRA